MCNLFLQFTGKNFYAHEKAVKSTHNFKHKRLEKRCNHALSEPFTLIQLSKMGLYYISNEKTRSEKQKDRYQRIQRRQAVFLFSLIFLITASHAASIFLCCVYGSHSFPYCLISASPAAFYFSTLHLSACSFPYYLSL